MPSTPFQKAGRWTLTVLAALTLGCGPSYRVGRLAARVIDSQGVPVGGVAADLYKVTPSGRVYWRAARTGADGVATFGGKSGVIEGEYIVHVTLMPWHMFAPGETNDRSVRVKKGDNVVISFRVVPRLPGRSAPIPNSSQLRLPYERLTHV